MAKGQVEEYAAGKRSDGTVGFRSSDSLETVVRYSADALFLERCRNFFSGENGGGRHVPFSGRRRMMRRIMVFRHGMRPCGEWCVARTTLRSRLVRAVSSGRRQVCGPGIPCTELERQAWAEGSRKRYRESITFMTVIGGRSVTAGSDLAYEEWYRKNHNS